MLDRQNARDLSFAFRGIEEMSQTASKIVEDGVDQPCSVIWLLREDLVAWSELAVKNHEYFNGVIKGGTVQGRELVWHYVGLRFYSHLTEFLKQQQQQRNVSLTLSYIELYYLFAGIRYYMSNLQPSTDMKIRWKHYSEVLLNQVDNNLVSLVGSMYVTVETEILRKKHQF